MITSTIVQLLVAVGGALLAVFGVYKVGQQTQKNKDKVKDHDRAKEIRDRVRDTPDNRVREYDDAGYRD